MQRNKKTRARAPEKKAEQFEKILEVGKDMFLKRGPYGFSMHMLAKKLNMSQPNLYNYVQSKRELWIAIKIKYFKEFQQGLESIIKIHDGRFKELFLKFAKYFLEFASSDYLRFKMMFLTSVPKSNKVGPYEESYKAFGLVNMTLKLIDNAIEIGETKAPKAKQLFYVIYGMLVGAAKVEADLDLKELITEPIVGDFYQLSANEYRKLVLEEIQNILESNY